MKAFRLFGLADKQVSPFEEGLKTEQIELHYAALGEGPARKAVLALTISQMAYVAVAIPKGAGWERIGIASCWCKYDLNPLREFLELRPVGDSTSPRFELVLRDSGGGTGIYEQTETHFRVYNGKLRKVISFQGARRWCRPTAPIIPCEVDRRWLDRQTLVEAHGQFDRNSLPVAAFRVGDLQDRYFTRVTCTPYEWDEKAFLYKRTGPPTKCAKPVTAP